jgi:hypothetical protein
MTKKNLPKTNVEQTKGKGNFIFIILIGHLLQGNFSTSNPHVAHFHPCALMCGPCAPMCKL